MRAIRKLYHHLASDSLYRNSIYLMLSTAVMAILGFFFWIINARLYSAEQVGLATTIISITTLISTFSLLGLGNGLIRYLPTSERKNNKINTAFSLVGLTSLIIGFIYLIGIKTFSPSLLYIQQNTFYALLFVVFVVFISLAALMDTVFIAYRSSIYVFIKNTLFSLVKLIFPLFLIGLGAYGIFISVGIATIAAVTLSLVILVWRFKYVFKPIIDRSVMKNMFKFSLGNYIAGFINGFPAMALPILITNSLGAKYSAYFYMDLMIANLLYIVPLAVSQSLFAEGSYSETELLIHLKKAVKIIALILIPAILLVFIFGNYILLIFGKDYSIQSGKSLQIMAITGIFLSINLIWFSILKIKHKIGTLILSNLSYLIATIFFVYMLIDSGIMGICWALLLGQLFICIEITIYTIYRFPSLKNL